MPKLNLFTKFNQVVCALFLLSTFMFFASCNDEAEEPIPSITSLSIAEGEAGTPITITGANFGAVQTDVKVFFNTTEASITTFSATAIGTTVPSGITPGEVDVKVRVKTLESANVKFTVLEPTNLTVGNFTTSIAENPAANATLGTISAVTNRGTLSYSISSQSVSGALAINTSSGQLSVLNPDVFDYEVNPSITAVVSVTNGILTKTANVTINITDVVEIAGLEDFVGSIIENPDDNQFIGLILWSAGTSTGSNTWAIVGQQPAGAVSIDNNGAIRVANKALFVHANHAVISGTLSLTRLSETKTASFVITVESEDTEPPITVTDIDGNEYQTVKIGNKIWMAENLRTSKLNDNTVIPYVSDENVWSSTTTLALSIYNNNLNKEADTYGILYNWYAVNTGKLCPTGWHIPTSAEWRAMEDYLAATGHNYDGTFLSQSNPEARKVAKSLASTSLWTATSVTGAAGNTDFPAFRNKSGFNAKPGGFRHNVGRFESKLDHGHWWTASYAPNSTTSVVGVALYYNANYIAYNVINPGRGNYCRCVQD